MAKVKVGEPLIKNSPLGGIPPLAIISTALSAMIYGIPETIVCVMLWAIVITAIVRYDVRLINESVIRVSDYLSTNYGLSVNRSQVKDYCKNLRTGFVVNAEALDLYTNKIQVYSLRFNDDYSEITPSVIHTRPLQKTS